MWGIKENKYKVLNRWYFTPERMSKMFAGISCCCWKCVLVILAYVVVTPKTKGLLAKAMQVFFAL